MPVRMLSEVQLARTAATAASAALPPAASTRRPTSAVAGWPAAIPAGTLIASSVGSRARTLLVTAAAYAPPATHGCTSQRRLGEFPANLRQTRPRQCRVDLAERSGAEKSSRIH